MDLGTIKEKIKARAYPGFDAYNTDLMLMCENCETYNAPETVFYKAAKKMRKG